MRGTIALNAHPLIALELNITTLREQLSGVRGRVDVIARLTALSPFEHKPPLALHLTSTRCGCAWDLNWLKLNGGRLSLARSGRGAVSGGIIGGGMIGG